MTALVAAACIALLASFACAPEPAPTSPQPSPAAPAPSRRAESEEAQGSKSRLNSTLVLHLVGDSTLAAKAADRFPETGWGEALQELVTGELRLVNHAVNGRSTKSFRNEGRWQQVLDALAPNHHVLIQFGHNDEKQHDPARYAAPHTTYRENLARFVREVRERRAHPLLATPVCRRKFSASGAPESTHGEYPAVVREVARQLSVPLVDLEERSCRLLGELGPHRSRGIYLHVPAGRYAAYPDGKQDDTHFSEAGAREVAKLFVEELKATEHPLSSRLTDNPVAASATPAARPLWAGVPPVQARRKGAESYQNERLYDVRTPALLPFLLPARAAPRSGVLVFPGGGYEKLSWEKEGTQVAHWLNSLGMQAFVVKYRLGSFGAPAPLLDARRALRLVRQSSAEYGVDPRHIGVIGFSAGGHLAASLSTHYDGALIQWDKGQYLAGAQDDELAEVSARPDFALLVYPVVSMLEPDAHSGSRQALLGASPAREALEFYSLERWVTSNTPATWLLHGQRDPSVSVSHSRRFHRALSAAGISSELVVIASERHGFGLDGTGGGAAWTTQAAEWLGGEAWRL